MKKYCFIILLCTYPMTAFSASPIKTNLSAGYTYDDNVTRAEFDNDIESDSILSLGASAAYTIPANDKSYFSLKGTLDVNRYLDFTKLSNTLIGIHGSYHIRPFTGYTATRFIGQLSYEERMFGSEQREGSATRILLGLSKRITDLFSLRAGFIKEDIDANSIVFDADNNRFYLDLDYRLNAKNNLYATIGYLDGNLVTTARGGLGIDYEYWVVDDAFEDLSPLRWAYKLSGNALTLRVGDSFTIDSRSALDGSILYYDSEADNYAGSKYTGFIYSVSYLYRF